LKSVVCLRRVERSAARTSLMGRRRSKDRKKGKGSLVFAFQGLRFPGQPIHSCVEGDVGLCAGDGEKKKKGGGGGYRRLRVSLHIAAIETVTVLGSLKRSEKEAEKRES